MDWGADMLSIKNLQFGHGSYIVVAENTAFGGGVYGVIGPSGSGKSTFLNTLAGFHDCESGSATFEDQDLLTLRVEDRPIAMLFQSNNLFPHLTIFRNVALAMTSRRWLTKFQQQQVSNALDRVGLSGFENRKPGELSGGQQSRAALARVLLQKKPILLLDEPFAALGPAMRNEMLDLVKEIAKIDNQIVLLVTHSPDDALRICDQTIFVSNKRLWLAGDTKIALQNIPSEMQDYFG